jgi:hypothetical protein
MAKSVQMARCMWRAYHRDLDNGGWGWTFATWSVYRWVENYLHGRSGGGNG